MLFQSVGMVTSATETEIRPEADGVLLSESCFVAIPSVVVKHCEQDLKNNLTYVVSNPDNQDMEQKLFSMQSRKPLYEAF